MPVLGILSPRQSIGTTFSEGPRRRTSETVPLVVGYSMSAQFTQVDLTIKYVQSR